MTRDEVYSEIREVLGEVPAFLENLPDQVLELEWQLFKYTQFTEGPVPAKYRELIGIAVSAARGCSYCAFFHTEIAKLYGATDAEISDAMHYTKSSVGWSTYFQGMLIPLEEFKEDVRRMCAYIRNKQMPTGSEQPTAIVEPRAEQSK